MRQASHPALRAAGLALICALAWGCSTPEQVIGQNWAGPTATQGGREYTPDAAVQRGIAGWVLLNCRAGADLSARDCVLYAETPAGWGFGDAALRTSAHLRALNADNYPGGKVPKPGEWFVIPVMFCPPDNPQACQLRMRAEVQAFSLATRKVSELGGAGDCVGAQQAAEALGQPAYVAFVEKYCRPAPAR